MEFFKHIIIAVDKVIPYAMNSRTHDDSQVTQLAASIREFGFTNPILLDDDNNLIAGHGRLMGAKKLGMSEVPAIVVTGLDDRKRRALVIADNKLALNAGWDDEILKNELSDLAGDFGELMGFSEDELVALLQPEQVEGLTDEDEVPEVPEQPVTVLGDVWLLGNHRLMCGDSTSIDAVERLMDGQKADMVFTDPPYGMGLDTDYSKMSGAEGKGKKYDAGVVDSFSPEMVNSIFSLNAKEVFIWGADYFAHLLPDRNEGSWFVWDKRESGESGKNVDGRFGSMFELCWSKVKHKREIIRYMWAGMMKQSDLDKGRHHPTQKPANLAVNFIEKYSDQKSIVADLFGGSGSTLIACEKTNRQSRLMELDPKYCDVIIKRWQDFTGKQAVHADTGIAFNG
jgi:DNA modification methylase